MKKQIITLTTLLSSLLVASTGHAHTGHVAQAGFAEGFIHPLSGTDHLVALIMMGAFIAFSKGGTAFRMTAYLAGALVAGFGAGVVWTQAASAETLVMLSLVALPVCLMMVTRRNGLVKTLAVLAMGVFSLSHGLVQGAEAEGAFLAYGMGTLSASMLVLAASAISTNVVLLVSVVGRRSKTIPQGR